jgi:ATP-dependent DNA helicase RecG|tara:strand:+ start:5931 stop:7397 length:1467 start_codon:yes stop_codon:yes gene_type:complete
MSLGRTDEYMKSVVHELLSLPKETEWVEFKQNKHTPELIGEYLSSLANSAALVGKVNAYLIWGVDDESHEIVGSKFSPGLQKVGNEELESWLLRHLSPKINFQFYEIIYQEKPIVILEIGAAFRHPVQFKNTEYIRIGSYNKKLKDFPEKERELWRTFDNTSFEEEIALENVEVDQVLQLLDYPKYFDSLNMPLPEGRQGIMDALISDDMISKSDTGKWNVTNLGALLFGKDFNKFSSVKRKGVRIILYDGEGKVKTIREHEIARGFATSFEQAVETIVNMLPSNEVIGAALRKQVPMFPPLAIRELLANAIIHQDFHIKGTAPMVEIFSNRMEVTNPGLPLVKTERFLDSPPKSRNELLASFLRRTGVCEERGSGIDKIVSETESYQLPAPLFETTDEHTRAVLFAHLAFNDMNKDDRVRACYLHACLKYVQRSFMTNASLRDRFGIEDKNSAIASRIIKETSEANLIRPYDPDTSRKYMKYIPFWA